ncbi:MAG: hypothetical protein IJZ07_08255 [Clostridia bacterium]|nr:hypothetical protein [Clostridia bacterium]
MDFDKIKPAVEEIQLSEIQQEKIIEACRNKKRKSFNYKLWIPIAAAAMFAVVIFSPGFIFRASEADMAPQENGKGYQYLADNCVDSADEEINIAVEDYITEEICSAQGYSLTVSVEPLFNSGVYREIYSVIPSQFVWLVDFEEYENWKKTVNASGGMAMLQFVEHFGITREEFDSANEAYKAYIDSTSSGALKDKPQNSNQEKREIFNADIVYSFDRKIIDEYYAASYK